MQNEFFAGERIAPENIEKKSEDIFTNSLNFSGLISDIIDNRLYIVLKAVIIILTYLIKYR